MQKIYNPLTFRSILDSVVLVLLFNLKILTCCHFYMFLNINNIRMCLKQLQF